MKKLFLALILGVMAFMPHDAQAAPPDHQTFAFIAKDAAMRELAFNLFADIAGQRLLVHQAKSTPQEVAAYNFWAKVLESGDTYKGKALFLFSLCNTQPNLPNISSGMINDPSWRYIVLDDMQNYINNNFVLIEANLL